MYSGLFSRDRYFRPWPFTGTAPLAPRSTQLFPKSRKLGTPTPSKCSSIRIFMFSLRDSTQAHPRCCVSFPENSIRFSAASIPGTKWADMSIGTVPIPRRALEVRSHAKRCFIITRAVDDERSVSNLASSMNIHHPPQTIGPDGKSRAEGNPRPTRDVETQDPRTSRGRAIDSQTGRALR